MKKKTTKRASKPKPKTPENRRAGKGGVIPPVEYQFKPGQSGNPGGRPKLLSGAYRAMLAEVNPRDSEGRTNAEIIAVAARVEALKGDVSAMREIRSATEGDKSYNYDLSKATDEQLQRIANGEDPAHVLASPGGSGIDTPPASSGNTD